MYIKFQTLGTQNLEHLPWTSLEFGGVIFKSSFLCAQSNLFLLFFLIFCALLQFFVKVCCSLLYEEGSNASWVNTSLLYFVIFCFPIVCQVKRFLHLTWSPPRNKKHMHPFGLKIYFQTSHNVDVSTSFLKPTNKVISYGATSSTTTTMAKNVIGLEIKVH